MADIDVDGAGRCADEPTAAGGEALAVHVDVSDAASVEAVIATIDGEFGVLHAAIHAAGGTGGVAPAALLETTVEGFERVVRLNLVGSFLVCRAVARHMVAVDSGSSDRSIVLVGSLQGVVGSPHLAPIRREQSRHHPLARTAALELAPVRHPGQRGLAHDHRHAVGAGDGRRRRRAASAAAIPLRRIGTGDDVAAGRCSSRPPTARSSPVRTSSSTVVCRSPPHVRCGADGCGPSSSASAQSADCSPRGLRKQAPKCSPSLVANTDGWSPRTGSWCTARWAPRSCRSTWSTPRPRSPCVVTT